MHWTRRDTVAIAALAIVPFLFYGALFAPWPALRSYFPDGDFVDQFYAFASFETDALADGRLPVWLPYAYGGAPFWADVQSAVAYPPSLAVVLSAAWLFGRLPFAALELEAVLHLSAAGAFAYLFARRTLGSRPGAALAALAFALGGYLTGYPPLQLAVLETDAWLPLALLGAALTLSEPASPPDTVGWRALAPHPLLPLALAMALLAGHPQSALYVLAATVAFYAWRAWPWRRGGWAPWMQLAVAVALALGLSAVGWLPAWQFLGLSNRAGAEYAALAHGFPPRELLGLALAGITLWSPLYVGVLPLVLAAPACWRSIATGGPEARDDRFWVALSGVALFLSLGGGSIVFDLFYLLAPGFDLFRGQERAAFLISFGVAMLAGRGMALWLAGDRTATRVAVAVALSLAGLGWLLTAVAEPSGRRSSWELFALSTFAVIVLLLGARGRSRRGAAAAAPPSVSVLAGVVVLALAFGLVVADLWLNGGRGQLVAAPPMELTEASVVAGVREQAPGRVANEDQLPANYGVLHAIELTSGASPLRLRTLDTLREALAGETEPRLWDLLAVTHVLTARESLPEQSRRADAVGLDGAAQHLHRLEADNPRAWRVSDARTVADDHEAIAALKAPDFDPHRTVVLSSADVPPDLMPDSPPIADGEPPVGSSGEARVESVAPGALRIRTDGETPGWLVVSEMHYPGWRATVDGSPVAVRRADVALMAVPVPAGPRDVRLEFTAPLVGTGAALTLAAAALLAAVAIARRSPRR